MNRLIRPLIARNPHEPGRVATPLELFFDLVCVVAIAAITAALHHQISHGHGADFVMQFVFFMVAIWWVWANFTWFASSFDNHDLLYRILVFVMMIGFAIFAGGIEYIFLENDATIGIIGWVVMRASLVLLWLRAAIDNPEYRASALTYAIGLTVVQILWVFFYSAGHLAKENFLLIGAVLMIGEFAVPMLAGRFNHPPLHRHHLVERHGLLNIIVLGEIVLASAIAFGALHGGDFNMAYVICGVTTMALTCMMWLYYFLEDDHLEAVEQGQHFAAWGYLHVIIFSAAALMGAAGAAQFDAVSHHSEASAHFLSLLTNGALAIYIFGIWIARDRFLRTQLARRTPLIGIALLLVSAAFAPPYWLSAVIFLAALVLRMFARQSEIANPEGAKA